MDVAFRDRLKLLIGCLLASLGGGLAGIYLGLWLSDPPVMPGDGPAMISAGMNARFGGLLGLLLGPLSMGFLRTGQPRPVERVILGILAWNFLLFLA